MEEINIHSIETFGTHEGPGIRLVIFLQGCPLKCIYCHNPDSQTIKKNKSLNLSKIQELLEKQKPYLGKEGGITFSGGEPLLQAKSLIPICKKLKEQGYHITIDTAGSILNEDVKELLNYIDLVLLDIKIANKEKYQKLTRGKFENFSQFLDYLEENKKQVWLRYVLMPGFTDSKEDIEAIKTLKDHNCVQRLEILPYHTTAIEKYDLLGKDYPYKDVKAPSKEKLEEVKEILDKWFKEVYIR